MNIIIFADNTIFSEILRPTPIQYHCIPPAIEGRDIIGAAKTGSGKTLAFVIPILQKLSVDPYGIYALVLTPTRELAFQVCSAWESVSQSVPTNWPTYYNITKFTKLLDYSMHILFLFFTCLENEKW